MARARNLREFADAIRPLQLPMFTIMYADRDGHIMHAFNGRIPVRPQGDWSFWSRPVRGDTVGLLWTRIHDFADLPIVVDPSNGWLQNANDPPWSDDGALSLRAGSLSLVFRPAHAARFPDATLAAHAPGGLAQSRSRSWSQLQAVHSSGTGATVFSMS